MLSEELVVTALSAAHDALLPAALLAANDAVDIDVIDKKAAIAAK